MLMKEIILWFSFLVVFLPCFCIILLCFLGWVRKDAFLRISLNLWIESICISATFCQNTHTQTLRLEFALLEESYLQIQFILQIKGYSGYFFLSKVWVSVTFERDCFLFFVFCHQIYCHKPFTNSPLLSCNVYTLCSDVMGCEVFHVHIGNLHLLSCLIYRFNYYYLLYEINKNNFTINY